MIALLPLFGWIKDFVIRILTDWKLLLVISVLVIVWYGWNRYSTMADSVVHLNSQLTQQTARNASLVDDINMLNTAALEKNRLIDQLQEDKKAQAKVLSDLTKTLEINNKKVESINQRIASVSIPPVKSQYLKEALIGVIELEAAK